MTVKKAETKAEAKEPTVTNAHYSKAVALSKKLESCIAGTHRISTDDIIELRDFIASL